MVKRFAEHPGVIAIRKVWNDEEAHSVHLKGLSASAAPMLFGALSAMDTPWQVPVAMFVLNDLEEAGYFYHDLVQMLGETQVLFFPSSYKRAIKYGQKDPANEVLRTEVLTKLAGYATSGKKSGAERPLYIVSYPDALAELVVSCEILNDHSLALEVGTTIEISKIEEVLVDEGFERVDYVYEPGQFAVRGSIIDVFSYASEYPYRVDFFGDEIDSIRTFEIETQLSRDKVQRISVVPKLGDGKVKSEVSFFDFLPKKSALAFQDYLWVHERIEQLNEEGLSLQAVQAMGEDAGYRLNLLDASDFIRKTSAFRRIEFGTKATNSIQATVAFDTSPQPLFHKNFELVEQSLNDLTERGFKLYILTDSTKQAERLKAIFEERGNDIPFEAVNKTIHGGFTDATMRVACFTDHQIFDRFHKYNLRSDKARSGKMAISLKELSQFEPGDYVVHIDHGVGRFAGLVRMPNGNSTQEVIKLVYSNDDVVFVSIHSLHKISKYKSKEGEAPRINKLGTGAWEKLKERTKTKIKDIARDLIKLYSQRAQEKGFAYSPDSF